MEKIKTFKQFLNEAEDFDTQLIKDVSQLSPGDQVFHMGKWQGVSEIRKDSITVYDDKEKASAIKVNDIVNRGILLKIPRN